MQPLELVTWAVRALSFFNTIAFLWLGLAVLLNAQRRPAGTWITGGGLLLAGFFFVVHSALVCREINSLGGEMAFWWRYLWLLFVVPPYMWFGAISWYSGVLATGPHRGVLVVAGLLGAAALLPVVAGTLPAYEEVTTRGMGSLVPPGGSRVTLLAYPLYGALCFGLALTALRRPGASKRLMGDLGRRRARPWLVAASLVLLSVSLSVGAAGLWLFDGFRSGRLDLSSVQTATWLMAIDMVISALLGLVVVLLGRAIVSYEIFTGKVLPRRGLLRHWRNSLILAAGYGVLMGGSLELPIDPTYRLMLATLLIAIFYALLSWRSYLERERSMEGLRPFVTSQRLYEQLLRPVPPLQSDVEAPFRALCEDVLGARVAYLVALGPLAPLVGSPLAYPPCAEPPVVELAGLAERFRAPGAMVEPLDAARFGEAGWAVPLWSERGLIGVLLLGEKRDGGLYVQEEIEVARAAGERLADIQASAEMARRLMAAQRRRLAETQLLDRRARRVLHDDILPRLHAALLTLSGGAPPAGPTAEAIQGLADTHRRIADLLREMPAPVAPGLARLGLVGALRQLVEVEMAGGFDGIIWRIEPEGEAAARELSPLAAEVVYGAAREAIRNAARHGRDVDGSRPLHLALSVDWRDGLGIGIEDDGVGLGASPSASGSGQGLALHSAMMAVLGGTLSVDAIMDARTRVSIRLPRETPV